MADTQTYSHRFLARVVMRTETPIVVGSGEKGLVSDKLIVKDCNGLPYIPGTAIAGIVRHAIGKKEAERFMGYPEKSEEDKGKLKEDKGEGSRIIFSSAQLVDENRKVIEGLHTKPKSEFLQLFENLPVRQHVAIDDKGVSKPKGKFDEEVVYKGTHFCFEIEMLSSDEDLSLFDKVLGILSSDTFRIGSGTRNGFGKMKIVEIKKACLDLKKPAVDLKAYIDKTSSLNDSFWDKYEAVSVTPVDDKKYSVYTLTIQPDDFFLFGAGYGDEEAQITPVSELCIVWDWDVTNSMPQFGKMYTLLPASSVKGAISHRLAYHYNRLNGYKIKYENGKYITPDEAKTGVDNAAVKALFGYVTEKDGESKRGNVILSDLMAYEVENTKILNHVAIDRFTGGGINGALFSEKVTYGKEQTYEMELMVNTEVLCSDQLFKEAFEATLKDIKTGMLPLGGGVNRGNGCFSEAKSGR